MVSLVHGMVTPAEARAVAGMISRIRGFDRANLVTLIARTVAPASAYLCCRMRNNGLGVAENALGVVHLARLLNFLVDQQK